MQHVSLCSFALLLAIDQFKEALLAHLFDLLLTTRYTDCALFLLLLCSLLAPDLRCPECIEQSNNTSLSDLSKPLFLNSNFTCGARFDAQGILNPTSIELLLLFCT